MKFKLFALILAFTLLSWSQTATQSNPAPSDSQKTESAAPADNKAECPCCQKMADAKDSHGCCHHHAKSADNSSTPTSSCGGKDGASCCGGKDGKMCMQASGEKKPEACCSGTSCDGKHAKGCCAKEKKGDTIAMACCAQHGHCSMHDAMHDHDINK